MAKKAKGNLISQMYDKHKGTRRETIPDGKYVCQFRSLTLTDMDGEEPKARLNGVIARGDAKGKNVTKFYSFYDRTTKSGAEMDGEVEFVRFMEDLAMMGIDTTEYSLEDLESVVKEDKPLAQISVKSSGEWTNVSIIGEVEEDDDDDDEIEEEDDDEEDDEPAPKKPSPKKPTKPVDDDDEDEEEEEEEQEDDEDDEEEESAEPTKGASCMAKLKGMRKASVFTIKAVNKSKKTVDLIHDATGKAYPGVSWNEIEIDDEDEE